MCGIAGIFRRKGAQPDSDVLDRMTDALVHRGPDGRGTFLHQNVGLGHRRLSIIGLSTGAQPMANQDESVVVSYNGEIYNYQVLREELLARGYVFRSESDTEVIVHGYHAFGKRIVDRLRGIFAFAIYDRRKQRLFCARDRLGVKPLYFADSPLGFFFASEPKALLLHPEVPKRPCLPALRLMLIYGYVPAPYSAFSGLNQLEPGFSATVTEEGTEVEQYWRAPGIGAEKSIDSLEALTEKVDETVRLEMMSEVPLGGFLSGGIDSSIVTAAMTRAPNLSESPRAFSIGFERADYDESKHAKKIAEHLRLNHHVEIVHKESVDLLDTLVGVYDEPFADSSAIPTYVLSKMTKKYVTVALSGDGGDEVFGGYRRYQKLNGWRELPGGLRHLSEKVSDQIPLGMRGQARLSRMSKKIGEQYEQDLWLFGQRDMDVLFDEELVRAESDWSLSKLFQEAPGEGPVQKAQWVDLVSYLPGDILTKVDRASMAHSLEVRVPLLDHEFVEWSARLHPSKTFADGEGKKILKEHLAQSVPRGLFERPKMGFGVPLEYWLGGSQGLKELADGLKSRHPKNRFFSPIKSHTVDELVARHGREDLSAPIWSVLFVESWWQKNFL